MTAPAPLTYPLSGLLAEPPGERRLYPVHGATIPLLDGLRLAEPLEGQVEIARTNRGVIVEAELSTAIEGSCARCLRDIDVPMTIHLAEEVLPSVDLASGAPLDPSAEPDVARLNGHHELELGTLVAEAISLDEPIAPLCEAMCPGLCPTCGERLDPGHPAHEDAVIDPRLAVLEGFRVDDEPETG
jgi:DUF177 domain-containing protein